jgi:hypothetical protein
VRFGSQESNDVFKIVPATGASHQVRVTVPQRIGSVREKNSFHFGHHPAVSKLPDQLVALSPGGKRDPRLEQFKTLAVHGDAVLNGRLDQIHPGFAQAPEAQFIHASRRGCERVIETHK